jgi:hypothetical protein
MTDQELLDEAARFGREAGTNAASWTLPFGFGPTVAARQLKMIMDGDPEVYDNWREPTFSGEYADDYSSDDLMSDLGFEPADDVDDGLRYELEDAYLDAARGEFWAEIERLLREAAETTVA